MHVVASVDIWGNLSRNDQQCCIKSALVADRAGHDSRRDSTVPLWLAAEPQHAGREHNPSLFHGTQCPDRASTLYLPDRNLAWVVAFSTSQGEAPQVVKMGWHLVNPRYSVFRYLREERELAWVLSRASQYCRTAALAMVFTCVLVGLDASQSVGWGNPYWRQRVLSLQNHDLEEVLLLEST